MQHRTIEADVLELKDKLIVLKSDDVDYQQIRAISNSFKKHGHSNVMVMCIGSDMNIEALSKEQAKEILEKIIASEDK
jgi:hypothetical protein